MSDSYHRELDRLAERLSQQSGEAALRCLQGMIELAKANGDGDGAAAFAQKLIQYGSHEGRLDYEMIGFGHLKALYESDPRYADLRDEVLWFYKWIAEHLAEYVDVSAEQIDSTLATMEQFYRAEKEGLRPVYALRCRAAAMMGRNSQARLFYEQWRASPRQESDDCTACQTHMQVQYLLDMERFEEAVEAATPILEGEQSCEEVPATTFSRLLLPLVLLGKADLALLLSSVVNRQVRCVPTLAGYLADHVVLLSIMGALERARRMAYVMLARTESSANTFNRFLAARAAWVLSSHLVRSGATSSLRLPSECGMGTSLSASDAKRHFQSRAANLADAFDARNGTDRFSRIMNQTEQLLSFDQI